MMKIIECPRDAIQGIHDFIPTQTKVDYINQLLKVGFDTIDFGSFVSPKAIPQLKDTAEVLEQLDLSTTKSKLLAIIANMRGAEDAVKHQAIQYLGFPLSISEEFQQRNTRKSIAQAFEVVESIQNLCVKHGKTLVVYISMGFGNPYGEDFSPEIVAQFIAKLNALNIKIVALSDTVGVANPTLIKEIFTQSIQEFPSIEIGAHFHSVPHKATEKVIAAYEAGCRRFDTAIGGMGGCPMAKDELTGNISTRTLFQAFDKFNVLSAISMDEFAIAEKMQMNTISQFS